MILWIKDIINKWTNADLDMTSV